MWEDSEMTTIVPSTTITLLPEEVTVKTINEQGVTNLVHTNIENIQQIFLKEQALETPLLPSQWGVVKYYRKNNYEGYVLTTAPTERTITLDTYLGGRDERQITIPVPPLLWVFEVRTDGNDTKSLTHSMMYALKHELLSMKDVVLNAPFPNLGIHHGICWGRENPPVPSSKSIQNIPARFFQQPFNNDLAGNRVNSFYYENEELGIRSHQTDSALHHMLHMADMLKEAKEAGEAFSYPFDTLKPTAGLTVEQAVKNYLPQLFN